MGFAALSAAAALMLTACGGDSGSSGGGSGNGAGFDKGSTEIVNPSDAKGGTLRFAISANMESTDPGNTYYGYVWNFSRYYARTLLTYAAAPGEAGTELVPDLAADMPEVSDDGTEWTVKLKEGLKYEDGTEIVAEHIKYAIARSNFGDQALPNGPKYFQQLLDEDDYDGPYGGGDPLEGFDAIETPDDYTLVFHLKEPFSDFLYVLAQPQTAPVPPEADKGEQYQTRVVSSALTSSKTTTPPATAWSWSATKSGTRTVTRSAPHCPTGSPLRKASTRTRSTSASSTESSTWTWPAPAWARR